MHSDSKSAARSSLCFLLPVIYDVSMERKKIMTSVFLSHSSIDKPFTRRLAADLTKKGIAVWFDEAELLVGDSLVEQINNGIESTEYLVVVLSKNSIKSQWTKKEVEIAFVREIASNRKVVLPVLIDDCEVPGYLRTKVYADFREPSAYEKTLRKLLKSIGGSRKSLLPFFSGWNAELAGQGIELGILKTASGRITIADEIRVRLEAISKDYLLGEVECEEGPGELILRAILEELESRGIDEVPYTLPELTNVSNQMVHFVLDEITDQLISMELLEQTKDGYSINAGTILMFMGDFAHLLVDVGVTLRDFSVLLLAHAVKIRLDVEDETKPQFIYTNTLLLWSMFENSKLYAEGVDKLREVRPGDEETEGGLS